MKLGLVRMFLWIVVILFVVLVGYIRLAPSEPGRWHAHARGAPEMGEFRSEGAYIWREPVEGDGRDRLKALDAVVLATPRTDRFEGSVDEAMITYITRSKWMGFPDYTTIGIHDGAAEGRYLEIYGRLRFGRSDLGVNAKRIKGWLTALKG